MRLPLTAAAAMLALAASGAQGRGLSVGVNHSVRLPLSGPAQSVVVSSPSIVDVSVVDSRTVYISGRAPGDTDVTVVDPLGRVVFRGDVVVSGGSAVSVFRGASRTDAMCAPYCHTLPPDQSAPATGASTPLGALMSAAAAGVAAAAPNMGSGLQAAASVPQAASVPH